MCILRRPKKRRYEYFKCFSYIFIWLDLTNNSVCGSIHAYTLCPICIALIMASDDYMFTLSNERLLLLRLPVGRGGVLNSPRFYFFFRCQKSAQRSWVIPLNIAVFSPTFKVNFLAEYLTKTHILTCILQHLNSKQVLGAKILIQDVL